MKVMKGYLREHMGGICLYAGFSGVFYVVFLLYDIQKGAVNYAFLLAGFVAFLYGLLGFLRYARRHRELLELENGIKAGLESLPVPPGLIEEDYQRILKHLYEEKLELETEGRIARQEMGTYYSMWVHQIKTPIAGLRLLIQMQGDAGDEECGKWNKKMKLELFKIEQYVEMALMYVRMESMSSDLSFDVYELDEILKKCIRKYSQMFILQKIRLKYDPVDKKVLTDEKWISFVVEQLLSNALKYTSGEGACVSVYMKGEELVIEDTGIGICPEDLPRVFERGFTGYNGRSGRKSTGIGLYLSRTVMDRLGHGIRIESEPDRGTKVFLCFSHSKLHVE
ncbi:sensor histidine kinase [Lachnospiraceae bacterium 48-42]|nr:HAMP domain-containing histidine kinase [Dorea sp.]